MATEEEDIQNDGVIPDNKYLLVSDSNEVSGQYDSRKLKQSELVKIAQEDMFNRLGMSRYVTVVQKDAYVGLLNVPSVGLLNPGKLRVQDGQVILLDADNIPDGYTPLTWLRECWNVPMDFTLTQVGRCMLRGVTSSIGGQLLVEKMNNREVGLSDSNMPPHMHHSAVTTGSSMKVMKPVEGGTSGSGDRYDVFNNDSFSTGLDKNELDGVVDDFRVEEVGDDVSYHNNMPVYRKFYVFVALKSA